MTEDLATRRAGLLYGVAAYLLWGVMPAYFKLVAHVTPLEIVAQRVLWSLLFLGALVLIWRRWPRVRSALRSARAMAMLTATALLIAANWLVFVWAVNNGHVLAGSLGYYLNPLINVLLGVVLLKEKLTRAQVAAVLLAGLGVLVLAFRAGEGLWISFSLALSFGLYGFIRKIAPVDALEGLSIETAILIPASILYIGWLQQQGAGGFAAHDGPTWALLALGGAVTAIPLLLFTAAARRLPYSTLGFIQYLAPSLQFLLAVLAFGEAFTTAHAICFGAIWIALAIFGWEGIRLARAAVADPKPA